MRKLLLGTAAVALGMTFVAAEANAQVKLDVGGHTKLYAGWLDQDDAGNDTTTAVDGATENVDVRNFDFQRDTEIHFTGETTLDNGLTIGFHTEAEADGSDLAGGGNSFNVQESYAYFSGAWGRVNFGAEDGATYLLQVAAPSADANVDGLRQYINPVNANAFDYVGSAANGDTLRLNNIFAGTGMTTANAIILDTGAAGASNGDIRIGANAAGNLGAYSRRLDYDHATSGYENKLTYMTPVFNGFQAGVSYTPELGTGIGGGTVTAGSAFNAKDTVDDYGSVWEIAGRWEGMLNELGVIVGGGYSHTELEQDSASAAGANVLYYQDVNGDAAFTAGTDNVISTLDDREAWNVGLDLDWKAFGLGGAYMEDDNGVSGDGMETKTWVVGLDYTTGPFKLGGSYLQQDTEIGGGEIDANRWTGGVVYTYGPGMTFRGSVSYVEYEENLGQRAANTSAGSEADATSFMLGTQINF